MTDTPHRPARHARPRRTGPYRPKYAIVDQPVKAPGFAAFSRRHPESVRQAGIAAIAGGLVVFAVASAVGAGASPTTRPKHVVAAPASTPAPQFDVLPPTNAPAIVPVVAAKPKPAPVNSAVISGLAANGIPTVALNAYRVAAARLAHAQPGCGIDWALLAGIGREESDHGQFAGAVLHADGVSTPRIIGIPLNGNGTALIRDTDHGVLDGDPVYDHALGPMQFIPSTWAIYGTDANGDGKADIFNINDAALTAARYLCAAGGDLHTHAGQVAAVLAYNDSAQYLAQVLALADAYRRGVSISGLPVGNVSGTLPPVAAHGAVPPANPGAPTANAASSKPKAAGSTATGAAKPGPGSPGAAGGGTVPAGPGGGTVPAGPGGGTSTPAAPGTPGSSSPAPASTPAPSPTTTKCALPDLLNPGKCAIPAK